MNKINLRLYLKTEVDYIKSFSGLDIYAGPSKEDTTIFVGSIPFSRREQETIFDIDISLFDDLDTFSIKIDNTTGNTYKIYDSYLLVSYLSDDSFVDTTNIVTLYEHGELFKQEGIVTRNRATIRKGPFFPVSYYLPNDWWVFTEKNLIGYKDFNNYEVIINHFGRFFHSPLFYGYKLPRMVTVSTSFIEGEAFPSLLQDISTGLSPVVSTFSKVKHYLSSEYVVWDNTGWHIGLERDTTSNEYSLSLSYFDGTQEVDYTGELSPITADFYVTFVCER